MRSAAREHDVVAVHDLAVVARAEVLAQLVRAASEQVGQLVGAEGHEPARDDGAVRAVQGGRASLLPAGITAVEGEFDAGDPVELVASDGRVVARGLVAFESRDIPDLLGRSTTELRAELGEGYDREVVHRDDLVLVRRRAR